LTIEALQLELEVIRERPFIEDLSSSGASAVAADGKKPDRVFDLQLVLSGESGEFEQFNGVVNDRGFIGAKRN